MALNRAVAVTERDGPEAGLAALKAIAGLEYSHLWHAALADTLCRLGRTSDAAGELHAAVTLAPSEVERRLLQGRLRTVRSEARRQPSGIWLSPTFPALFPGG